MSYDLTARIDYLFSLILFFERSFVASLEGGFDYNFQRNELFGHFKRAGKTLAQRKAPEKAKETRKKKKEEMK